MMEDFFSSIPGMLDEALAAAGGLWAGYWAKDKKHRILIAFSAFVGIMFLIAVLRTVLG